MSSISEPLVSIVVVTYNSSDHVVETLESAREQTYKNIELIISDDCSTDKTVDICRNWIETNKVRFIRTKLVTIEQNTGVASNCNRGLKESRGIWIKFIAGDDIILKDGIRQLVEFQKKYDDASFIHGRVIYIDNAGKQLHTMSSRNRLVYPTFEEEIQSNKIHTPSVLFLKSALEGIGGFKNQYKIEDIYAYLKLLSIGRIAYYTDSVVAKYRIHQQNRSSDSFLMLDEHIKILKEYKGSKGFVRNFYIFCRDVLLYNIVHKNHRNRNIRLIIQQNPLVLISIFDINFWFHYLRYLVKSFLK